MKMEVDSNGDEMGVDQKSTLRCDKHDGMQEE